MIKAWTKKNGSPDGEPFVLTGSMRPWGRSNKKTMRAKIPRINKGLVATRVGRIAGSLAVDHVEGNRLRLSYTATATFCAVRCHDCEATYENLERSHFLLHRNWPDATFPDGKYPHRAT
jgi:nitrate/TMAO reductase-like tetraheme cytochrome c subunit